MGNPLAVGVGLLVTVVLWLGFQGRIILDQPLLIAMLSLVVFANRARHWFPVAERGK